MAAGTMGLGEGMELARGSIGMAGPAEEGKTGAAGDGELGGGGGVAPAVLGAGLGLGCGEGVPCRLGISGPATFSMYVENFLRNFRFLLVT